jgi:chitin disaccharide deacetylase
MLVINADDWGKNKVTTNNSMDCFKHGRITSVSAMVFMEDSQRAAELALEHGLDAGLHLNFTSKFDQNTTPSKLLEYQQRINTFLRTNRYCSLLYNPILIREFHCVFSAQYEEYTRLYHKRPTRIDGHHHMHLCTNVLLQRLIPDGSKVRRNFSFTLGEKNIVNRWYRSRVDQWLQRRYQCTDFFFSIKPIHRLDHLHKIIDLSWEHAVELMVHPEKQDEYSYLLSTEYMGMIRDKKIGSFKIML